MSSIWDRFEGIVKAEEVVEAKAQSQPLDEGTYEMTLVAIEAGETQSGLPAMKAQFKMGTGKIVYFTQVLQNLNYPNLTSLNISKACEMIEGLTGEEYVFTTMGDLATKITSIPVDVNYIVEVSYETKDTAKKYPKLKVLESSEDVPF